jgi:hypothetical protein
MKPDQIERLVASLPKDQQEEATHRVNRAIMDGVEDIGLWTGDEPPDITDLVGNCPKKLAALRANGDAWSSGLIHLTKYASL